MDKVSRSRHGKIVPSGHSTCVEGVKNLIKTLEQWPEITSIRLGPITPKRGGGRGGFNFKASRPATVGTRVTGINCHATSGSASQLIVLAGPDLDKLTRRLRKEGYGANW